jgi:hypothetical protein
MRKAPGVMPGAFLFKASRSISTGTEWSMFNKNKPKLESPDQTSFGNTTLYVDVVGQ